MRLSLPLSPMLWNLSLMACRLSLNWSSFALPGQSLQSAGPWEQDEFWPLIAANFKNKHHPASAPNFIPSLLHTANTIHHLFGLSCDPLVTQDVFEKSWVSFRYRFGYLSARIPLCKSRARETERIACNAKKARSPQHRLSTEKRQ